MWTAYSEHFPKFRGHKQVCVWFVIISLILVTPALGSTPTKIQHLKVWTFNSLRVLRSRFSPVNLSSSKGHLQNDRLIHNIGQFHSMSVHHLSSPFIIFHDLSWQKTESCFLRPASHKRHVPTNLDVWSMSTMVVSPLEAFGFYQQDVQVWGTWLHLDDKKLKRSIIKFLQEQPKRTTILLSCAKPHLGTVSKCSGPPQK